MKHPWRTIGMGLLIGLAIPGAWVLWTVFHFWLVMR